MLRRAGLLRAAAAATTPRAPPRLSLGGGKAAAAAAATPFRGSYLDAKWARRFVLGHVLQVFSGTPEATDETLLALQRTLSERWALPAKPLDPVSNVAILRLLGRYAVGQGPLSLESIAVLDSVAAPLGIRGSVEDPAMMHTLLERLGFVRPGDNLRRLVFKGELLFPDAALAVQAEHLDVPVDPFDALRETAAENIYAIDSASTSEVDDAIGIHYDARTGAEWITVYVSDATVHCPFDSALEKLTARQLTTTSYLPEGVFFMLPHQIVEAATLRADRPCRTFNVVFQIDDATGELKNFRVGVGWAAKLRRITYDAVQELYDAGADKTAPLRQSPAWVTPRDVQLLHRIHAIARIRMAARSARAKNKIESNLPDPLIKVDGTRVVSVTDQILCTKDARIAVAELMIAANEVCSRVAQAQGVPIPFRGTRPLSPEHEAAKSYVEPRGSVPAAAAAVAAGGQQPRHFAQTIFESLGALSSVTRAIYAHEPLFHAGLDTRDYSHATSPLRRYPDMLLHHQLKCLVATQAGRRVAEEPIPEFMMAELCASASAKQEAAALLQDSSSRFWLLVYMRDNLGLAPPAQKMEEAGAKTLLCIVGATRDVSACPEYGRFAPTSARWWSHYRRGGGGGGDSRRVPRFVSDVYIPQLQMTHVVFHDNAAAVDVGATLRCVVDALDPALSVLELRPVAVEPRNLTAEEVMRQALIPLSDS